MARPLRISLTALVLIVISVLLAACGMQNINVSRSDATRYTGAQLFAQRCSGCHSLSYAGARGSAAYVRDKQMNNGPNFNVRCERPIARVLYAIENGGFSGAIMPQNIVVGAQARAVAEFVAKYAGQQAPKVPGVPTCAQQSIGTLPAQGATTTSATPTPTQTQRAASTGSPTKKSGRGKAKTKAKATTKKK